MNYLLSMQHTRRLAGMFCLCGLMLALAACGGGAVPAAPLATAAAAVAGAATSSAVNTTAAPAATAPGAAASATKPAPAAGKTAIAASNPAANSSCAAADDAYLQFAFSSQLIIQLRSDEAYAGLVGGKGGLFNLDTAALRANLDVFAKLPDAVSESGDKTSTVIATTRQVLDLIDSNAKSGKPFTDGSGNGQKVLDLWTPLALTQRADLALIAAFKGACATYTPAPRATATPRAFAQKSKAECDALSTAVDDLGQQAFILSALTTDDAYAVFQPGSPFPVDMAAIGNDLTVLAALPDVPEVEALYHGKPSQLIPIYRQMLAQIDANIKAGSTPFSDGSGNGQKVVDLAQAAMGDGRNMVFGAAMLVVCQ